MTVRCAHCGEEMLGAVNRCWKCGQSLVANAERPDLPPQRRRVEAMQSPMQRPQADSIAMADVLEYEAEIVEAEEVDSPDSSSPTEAHQSGVPGSEAAENRRTSAEQEPPGEEPPPPITTAPVADSRPSEYRYPAHHPTAATGGAFGAVILGIAGLVASLYTLLAALLAMVGLALGAWGASSNRRGTALIGILLCCVTLLACMFSVAILSYEYAYGVKPWEPAIPASYDQSVEGQW